MASEGDKMMEEVMKKVNEKKRAAAAARDGTIPSGPEKPAPVPIVEHPDEEERSSGSGGVPRAKAVPKFSYSDEEFKSDVSKNPVEAAIASLSKEYDVPLEALFFLEYFKTSDVAKLTMPKILLKLPKSMNTSTIDKDMCRKLRKAKAVQWGQVKSMMSRNIVFVNIFNLMQVLEEKVNFVTSDFNIEELKKGKISFKTNRGINSLDFNNDRSLYDSATAWVTETSARKIDEKLVFQDVKVAVSKLTATLMTTTVVKIEDGKYVFDEEDAYQGSYEVPAEWVDLINLVAGALNGARPTGLDISKDVVGCIYTDITRLEIDENIKAAYVKFKEFEVDKLAERVTVEEDMQRRVTNFLLQDMPPAEFQTLKNIQNEIMSIDAKFGKYAKRLFADRNAGVDLAGFGNNARGAFLATYTALWICKNLYKRELYGNNNLVIALFGSSIGSTATYVEELVDLLKGPALIVTTQVTSALKGKCFRRDLDNMFAYNPEIAYGRDKKPHLFYVDGFSGMKVRRTEQMATLIEMGIFTDEDLAMLGLIRDFGLSKCKTRKDVLLVKHNLMHPDKFVAMIVFIQSFGLLARMLPHPSGESDAFYWVLYGAELNNDRVDVDGVYALRLVECGIMLQAYEESRLTGLISNHASKYTDVENAKLARMMVLWLKLNKRAAKLGKVYGTRSVNVKQAMSSGWKYGTDTTAVIPMQDIDIPEPDKKKKRMEEVITGMENILLKTDLGSLCKAYLTTDYADKEERAKLLTAMKRQFMKDVGMARDKNVEFFYAYLDMATDDDWMSVATIDPSNNNRTKLMIEFLEAMHIKYDMYVTEASKQQIG